MNKKILYIVLACLIVGLVQTVPGFAQAEEPEPVPVVGTFDYEGELIHQGVAEGITYFHRHENEVWSGSFEGAGEAYYKGTVYAPGHRDIWLVVTFTGSVLGDKEGTMEILLIGDRPNSVDIEGSFGEWFGRWMIVRGTDDLENVYGQGIWWGQGGRAPEGTPKIYYTGEVVDFGSSE